MSISNKFIEMNEAKNIKLGIIFSYAGMAVSIVGALFVLNRVLNYIGDYNYGLYSFVGSITTWLTVISSALTASFLRYTTLEANQSNGDVSKTNTIYLKMLLLIGIVVFVVGFSILGILYMTNSNIGKYNWEDSQLMYLLFALSIFNIVLTMPTTIFSLYINYKKQFVFGKLLAIVISIISFSGQLLIAYFTKNIVAIAVFAIVINLLTCVCNAYFSYKALHINFAKVSLKENKSLVYSIFVFSGILLFNSVVDQINTNVDKTLLGIFSKPEDVTIYHMAQQLSVYFMFMSVSVSGVFAPKIHELTVKHDIAKINDLYLKASKLQSIILCGVAFGFLTCGFNFIIWWIGEERITAYYVATTLLLLNIGPLTLNSSIEIQRARNQHLFRAITYFVLAIANVGLSIMFLQIFEPEYAVFACLAGTVISTICSHWIAMNLYNKFVMGLPIGRYLFTLSQYMLLGVVSHFVVLVCNKLFINQIECALYSFITQGLVFVCVYMIMVAILNKTDIKNYFRNKSVDLN